MTGMLSRGRIGVPQAPHRLGGVTMLSPAGTRAMTTFRNDPISRPSSALNATSTPVMPASRPSARRLLTQAGPAAGPPPPGVLDVDRPPPEAQRLLPPWGGGE